MVRAAVIAGLAVFAVGGALVWLGWTPGDAAAETCPAVLPEGSSSRVEPALWPPGARRCEIRIGGVERAVTAFPWRDWLTAAVVAAAAALLAAGTASGRRRAAVPAAVATGVFLAAVVAWFLPDAIALPLVAAAIAAAASAGVRLRRSAAPR